MSKLAISFVTLCMLAGPALATPVAAPAQPPAHVEKVPARTPASAADLDRYAARERAAEKLAHFEGGRGRGIETGTLILILLLVIIIILIV